jgi:hypothetical protein
MEIMTCVGYYNMLAGIIRKFYGGLMKKLLFSITAIAIALVLTSASSVEIEESLQFGIHLDSDCNYHNGEHGERNGFLN